MPIYIPFEEFPVDEITSVADTRDIETLETIIRTWLGVRGFETRIAARVVALASAPTVRDEIRTTDRLRDVVLAIPAEQFGTQNFALRTKCGTIHNLAGWLCALLGGQHGLDVSDLDFSYTALSYVVLHTPRMLPLIYRTDAEAEIRQWLLDRVYVAQYEAGGFAEV